MSGQTASICRRGSRTRSSASLSLSTPEGKEELVGFTDGARESAHDWRDLLLDLKRRGLRVTPRPRMPAGGAWCSKAGGEGWAATRRRRWLLAIAADGLVKVAKAHSPNADGS